MFDQSDHPEDSSFEIEPSRLRPNESLQTNIVLVLDVVKRFLRYLIETVDSLPKWVQLCYLWLFDTVLTDIYQVDPTSMSSYCRNCIHDLAGE